MTTKGNIVLSWIVLLSLSPAPSHGSPLESPWNRTASQFVTDYITAFNASDEALMRAFLKTHVAVDGLEQIPIERRLDRYREMKQNREQIELQKILAAGNDRIEASMRDKKGNKFVMTFVLEPSPPHGLIGIRVEDTEGPAAPGSVGEAKTTIRAFIAATTAYVDSLSKVDEFSGVVQVSGKGKPLIQMARGFADRDQKIGNDLKTRLSGRSTRASQRLPSTSSRSWESYRWMTSY